MIKVLQSITKLEYKVKIFKEEQTYYKDSISFLVKVMSRFAVAATSHQYLETFQWFSLVSLVLKWNGATLLLPETECMSCQTT